MYKQLEKTQPAAGSQSSCMAFMQSTCLTRKPDCALILHMPIEEQILCLPVIINSCYQCNTALWELPTTKTGIFHRAMLQYQQLQQPVNYCTTFYCLDSYFLFKLITVNILVYLVFWLYNIQLYGNCSIRVLYKHDCCIRVTALLEYFEWTFNYTTCQWGVVFPCLFLIMLPMTSGC